MFTKSAGGGWGNPLERDPVVVAREVRQGLVRDPARYGVVLTDMDQVNDAATDELRDCMAPAQSTLRSQGLFNRGGTLPDLARVCMEETGFPPPMPPSGRTLRGPIARLKHIMELHARRKIEDAQLFHQSN